VVWYHGTTREAWERIQKQGALHGDRGRSPITGKPVARCTYLARDLEEARQYGDVILEVDYEPMLGQDNYEPGGWQIRVYTPIPLWNVKLLEEGTAEKQEPASGVHEAPPDLTE